MLIDGHNQNKSEYHDKLTLTVNESSFFPRKVLDLFFVCDIREL